MYSFRLKDEKDRLLRPDVLGRQQDNFTAPVTKNRSGFLSLCFGFFAQISHFKLEMMSKSNSTGTSD